MTSTSPPSSDRLDLHSYRQKVLGGKNSQTVKTDVSWADIKRDGNSEKALEQTDKNLLSRLNKSLGNTPYKAEPEEDEESRSFKFRDNGLLAKRITIEELESLNSSDINQLKLLLSKTNIDTLVKNLNSNDTERKAEAKAITEIIFKFAIDFKQNEIDALVDNLDFGDGSEEANKDLKAVIEKSRNMANQIIEKKTENLNLNPTQNTLREKVLEFLKFEDNFRVSGNENTERKLNILKEIFAGAATTADLMTFNRTERRSDGYTIYDAKLFKEISKLLGGDEMASKFTVSLVDAFHDVLNYSEAKLYNHAYEEKSRDINTGILEIQKNIFDKIKNEKFADLNLVEASDRDTKFSEVLTRDADYADKFKAYKELKISLIRDILFLDIEQPNSAELQRETIKKFIQIDNNLGNEIEKTNRQTASIEEILSAVNKIDTNKGLERNSYSIKLELLIDGNETLVKDDFRTLILDAYGVTNISDLTPEQRNGSIDILLGDIKISERTRFKERLREVKSTNNAFVKDLKEVLEEANREIFSADAYGNREFKVLSNLEANLDRFMHEYTYINEKAEANITLEAATFLGTLAAIDLQDTYGSRDEIENKLKVLGERLELEKKKTRELLFGNAAANDENTRIGIVSNLCNQFNEFIETAKHEDLKSDDTRSIDEVFTEFQSRASYVDLTKSIDKYTSLDDKKSKEALFLEMEIMKQFLHEYCHLADQFDYGAKDARIFMQDSVKELIERKSGVNVDNDNKYRNSGDLFNDILGQTKDTLIHGVSLSVNKFLELISRAKKTKEFEAASRFDIYNPPSTELLDKFYERSIQERGSNDDRRDVRDFLREVLTRVLGSLINEKIVPLNSNKPASGFGDDGAFLEYFDIVSSGLTITKK